MDRDYRGKFSVEFCDFLVDSIPEKRTAAALNTKYASQEYYYMNLYSHPTDVVFTGDSITFYCPWNELYPELSVKNRGIGSDSTFCLLSRIDSIIKTEPDKIFIMTGVNDFAYGYSVEEAYENYLLIIEGLRNSLPTTEIYVQSCLPCALNDAKWNPQIVELNGKLFAYCEENDVEYIDLWQHFIDEEKELAEQYSLDGIHLTAKGYELWKAQIDQYVYE